jgi:hypothetical protein
MSVAARALMAAAAIGFAGAACAQDVDQAENGVHAAPTGPVAQAPLGPPARAGAAAVRRVATAPRLTLQAVPAAPAPDEVAPMDPEPAAALEPAPADALDAPSEEAAVMGRRAAPAPASGPPEPTDAPEPGAFAQEAAPAPQEAPALADAAPPAGPEDAPSAAPDAGPAPALAEAPPTPPAEAPALAAEAAEAQDVPDAIVDPAPPRMARVGSAPAPAEAPMRLARAEPPPQPPAPDEGIHQHVGFPRRSADAASAFVRYMDRASRIDAGLTSGQAVEGALEAGSAYDVRQLDEGMIAYGAIAALQSQAFVYGVMDIAAREGSRREMVETLLSDPAAAARLPGAAEAAALAGEAVGREGRRVVAAGRALKQAAYDVQLQAWSKARPADQPGRLASAKTLSSRRAFAREGDVAKLIQRIASVQPARDGAPFTPVALRSVALAALSVLDGAGEENAARLQSVTSDPGSAQCLKMAKLNLFQCLSVAGPEYEDVYCAGQHAVLDTGQCVVAAAEPMSPLLKAALPRRRSAEVMIPTGSLPRAPTAR